MKDKALHILWKAVSELTPFSANARTHSKKQLRQIGKSIDRFGFTNPVLLGPNNTILAGHGRVEAAKLLGMTEVPTILLEHLTPDERRAYVIADNRLAEKAGWNNAILSIELQYLSSIENFDVTVTGFETPEIDSLLLEDTRSMADPEPIEALPSGPPVTQSGCLWIMGNHRLLCGNSLDEKSFEHLLGERRADMVLVDPPYNVPVDGHATGNGSVKHREFPMASGEMSKTEFAEFLVCALSLLARYSREGSVHFIFMSWHFLHQLLEAGMQVYDCLLNIVVWAKDRAGMGSLYRSHHELCPVFRNGKASHRNNIQLGRFGRDRSNVWNYPGSQTLSKQGNEQDLLQLHPTVKNTAMLADAILDCSAQGDLILDSFAGSGSTFLAAERVGRVCYGIEIDPLYVDLAIRRWERKTGKRAIHAITGKLFCDMEGDL